ncbi:MAG: EI24 domain-containing protein [Oligoflexia bacterium]|nr:EI24 domain-containing protein [Oligoflexia bacterium]
MKKLFDTFNISLHLIKSDRSLQTLLLFPLVIGALLYLLFAILAFKLGVPYLQQTLIKEWALLNSWAQWISYILVTLTAILLIVLLNFTFVVVVSLFSSPFHQMISDKVEALLLRSHSLSPSDFPMEMPLKMIIYKLFLGGFNDLKRISFILFVGLFAFFISFIPFLTPISIILSALLVSYQFLDYNWSRHQLGVFSSLAEIKNNLFYYLFFGICFLFILSIPLINLLGLPFAVVFYSVYWTKFKI